MSLRTQTAPKLPEGIRVLIQERISSGLELPFQSDTSARVLALCNDERCDAKQLSELIQLDQALAGHVLGISNSAAYAPKEPIVSLQQAVSRLGVSTICSIAIAVSLKGAVFNIPGHAVTLREMWMHSAATAVYAKEVARFLRMNVEGAFLCGLLHDVGKPLVLMNLVEIAREKTDRPVPPGILDAAMDVFHEHVGTLLITDWELPDWMVEVVGNHHHYERSESKLRETMVVNLADHLTHWALGDANDVGDFPSDLPVLAALSLYPDDVDELLAMRAEVLEVTGAFL